MYKVYKTGQEFLDENLDIIRKDPLGTTFFEGNANMISQCDERNFAIRVDVGEKMLIAIQLDGYPMVIYGSEQATDELAKAVVENKLQFDRVIGYLDVTTGFLTRYERLVGGSHVVNLSMDVMYCKKVNPCDTSGVELPTAGDAEEIARLIVEFDWEAVREESDFDEVLQKVNNRINDYAVIRADGKIVSMCYRYVDSNLDRLSYVYTREQYRNQGYSRKVVTYVTQSSLKSGHTPYLHVDQHNPVSNHLYVSIGYVYDKSRYEIAYIPSKMK